MPTKKTNPWASKGKTAKPNPWGAKATKKRRPQDHPLVALARQRRQDPHAVEKARLTKQIEEAEKLLDVLVKNEKALWEKVDKLERLRRTSTPAYEQKAKPEWEQALNTLDRQHDRLRGLLGRRRRLAHPIVETAAKKRRGRRW